MHSKENIYVACYGTLRPGFGNNRLLVDSEHIGTGKTIEKYTLRASGIPFVSKDPLHSVVVDVYKVDEPTLKNLDSLEGHPEWYKREQIAYFCDFRLDRKNYIRLKSRKRNNNVHRIFR